MCSTTGLRPLKQRALYECLSITEDRDLRAVQDLNFRHPTQEVSALEGDLVRLGLRGHGFR